MTLPRVWLVPYAENWSYGFNARAVAEQLADRFEFRIAYGGTTAAELRAWKPDAAVDFWWHGRVRRMLRGIPVLKQVSSHRWSHARYGSLDVRALVRRHLATSDAVLVPSRRLALELRLEFAPRVYLTPKGFDPRLFGDEQRRRGDLVVGWAGKASADDKRLDILRAAEPALEVAGGTTHRADMASFYNRIDVITCASEAEGDPLTLIEGMACGCFPVVVDVGIVPELVRHGENGLIVERTPRAFAAAFEWCRANVELVRAAGRRNAEQMLHTRTWAQVAGAWGTAFDGALQEPPRG